MARKKGLTKSQKVTLWVAAIGAIGAIIAALIGIIPDLSQRPSTTVALVEYSGRVIDSTSGTPVDGAKVTLDTAPVPIVRYTDSEGVFLFVLPTERLPLSVTITVSHRGYTPYTRNIHLTANNAQLEEIHLEAVTLPKNPVTQQPVSPGIWLVSVFDNASLEGEPVSRAEIPAKPNGEGGYTLRFDPVQAGISAPYSVRWVGLFELSAGTYEFHCKHRDGCRISVDTRVWVDAWWDGAGGHDLARELKAGQHRVIVEFYDKSGVGWLEMIMRKK